MDFFSNIHPPNVSFRFPLASKKKLSCAILRESQLHLQSLRGLLPLLQIRRAVGVVGLLLLLRLLGARARAINSRRSRRRRGGRGRRTAAPAVAAATAAAAVDVCHHVSTTSQHKGSFAFSTCSHRTSTLLLLIQLVVLLL